MKEENTETAIELLIGSEAPIIRVHVSIRWRYGDVDVVADNKAALLESLAVVRATFSGNSHPQLPPVVVVAAHIRKHLKGFQLQ